MLRFGWKKVGEVRKKFRLGRRQVGGDEVGIGYSYGKKVEEQVGREECEKI